MNGFELPLYFIVGIRPVKFVDAGNGELMVLKLNFELGEFEPGMEFYRRCLHAMGDDVRQVSEDDFIQQVERIRGRYMKARDEGPIFPLYDLINGIEEQAYKEERALTPWEAALVTRTRRETHQLFEVELQKRKESQPAARKPAG